MCALHVFLGYDLLQTEASQRVSKISTVLTHGSDRFSILSFNLTYTMSGKGAKGLSGALETQLSRCTCLTFHVDVSFTTRPPHVTGKGAKGTMGSKQAALDKKKPTSRSSRAGLQFPVGRVHRLLKVRHAIILMRLTAGKLRCGRACDISN